MNYIKNLTNSLTYPIIKKCIMKWFINMLFTIAIFRLIPIYQYDLSIFSLFFFLLVYKLIITKIYLIVYYNNISEEKLINITTYSNLFIIFKLNLFLPDYSVSDILKIDTTCSVLDPNSRRNARDFFNSTYITEVTRLSRQVENWSLDERKVILEGIREYYPHFSQNHVSMYQPSIAEVAYIKHILREKGYSDDWVLDNNIESSSIRPTLKICLTNKDVRNLIDKEYVTVRNNIFKTENDKILGIIRNK